MAEEKQNQVLIVTIPRGSMSADEKAQTKKELQELNLNPVFVEFNPTTTYPPRFDILCVDAKVLPVLRDSAL